PPETAIYSNNPHRTYGPSAMLHYLIVQSRAKETGMSDLFWLTDEQMERLRPFFPKSHSKPRVDDRRV
ncbi:hypothetical protein FB595_1341, partial [Sphingobium sp. AEW010]